MGTNRSSPLPLGATWIEEEQGFNFAVYAGRAASVTLLLLFDRHCKSCWKVTLEAELYFRSGLHSPGRPLFDQMRSACPLAGGHGLPAAPNFSQNSNICK